MSPGLSVYRNAALLAIFLIGWVSAAGAADRVVVVPLGGGKPLKNVVTVAKGNGDFTDPVAAMNSITDASATNPYLLLIGPGHYTLTTALIMKPFVDVSGSGEKVTWLSGARSSGNIDETAAIVKAANNATLSNLSIKNTGGGGAHAFGVFTTGLDQTAHLQQISVYVNGDVTNNIGIVNYTSSSPLLSEVTVAVQGGTNNFGIYNAFSSTPTIFGLNALVWGGSASYGIYNFISTTPLVIERANIFVNNGSSVNVAIYNYNADNVKIRRSTLSGTTRGVQNVNGSDNTKISQSTVIYGIFGGGATCVASDNDLGVQYSAICTIP